MYLEENSFKRNLSTPEGRWAAIGPYYAMFPLKFAYEVVKQFSRPGQYILDPFAGRASSIYTAAIQGRCGLGIEINPVGWLYGKVKLNPGRLEIVEKRLKYLVQISGKYSEQVAELPEFFHLCYTRKVLEFLFAARTSLNWKKNLADATLMALILVYLHGKKGQALSNQMRQSKAMAPEYSIKWWGKHKMEPPEIDPYEFLIKRIRWRYAKGVPSTTSSQILNGDSVKIMNRIVNQVENRQMEPYSLLFTSPPYYGVTNYYYDQWLRLWMLGGPSIPISNGGKYTSRFLSKKNYRELLNSVFQSASQVMTKNSTIYVRTDAREFTLSITLEILRECFPSWREKIVPQPVSRKTQTSLYGDTTNKPGEVDIILTSKNLMFL